MRETFQGVERVVVRHAKAESIIWEVEQSLRRLGTDWIDLLQYHHPDPDTPLEESLNAMHQVVQQGKVRHLGVSNLSVDQMREVLQVGPISTSQNSYSLLRRDIEQNLIPFCLENGIGILCYGALGRGILAGKTTSERAFPTGDLRLKQAIYRPENRKLINETIDHIRPIAKDHHCSVSQLVLAWTLRQSGIHSIIVGVRNPEQALSLAQVEQIDLNEQVINLIDTTFQALPPKLDL